MTNIWCFDEILLWGMLSDRQFFRSGSSVKPPFYSWSLLWCVAGSAPQALHLPAITGLLYCEAANESMAAPLSVSSISEASALAFCCVIYAKLFSKMSFLSPIAPSACERAWHPSVIISFKDAFACFCHSPCWFLNLLLFSLPPCRSQLATLLASLVPSIRLNFLPTFVVLFLYQRISRGNVPDRVTLYCTLDTGELRIFSMLWSFSTAGAPSTCTDGGMLLLWWGLLCLKQYLEYLKTSSCISDIKVLQPISASCTSSVSDSHVGAIF